MRAFFVSSPENAEQKSNVCYKLSFLAISSHLAERLPTTLPCLAGKCCASDTQVRRPGPPSSARRAGHHRDEGADGSTQFSAIAWVPPAPTPPSKDEDVQGHSLPSCPEKNLIKAYTQIKPT